MRSCGRKLNVIELSFPAISRHDQHPVDHVSSDEAMMLRQTRREGVLNCLFRREDGEWIIMNAIRIRKRIDSDTLHLPELAPFLGHTVDIVIEDQPATAPPTAAIIPGTGDWDGFRQAAQILRPTYDYDAIAEQDARDLRDAQDQMR
jgi:hypothetical protein